MNMLRSVHNRGDVSSMTTYIPALQKCIQWWYDHVAGEQGAPTCARPAQQQSN